VRAGLAAWACRFDAPAAIVVASIVAAQPRIHEVGYFTSVL